MKKTGFEIGLFDMVSDQEFCFASYGDLPNFAHTTKQYVSSLSYGLLIQLNSVLYYSTFRNWFYK